MSKVVDFQQFRASRQARESKPLPLFDGIDPVQPPTSGSSRHLTARELTHRERMLKHLKTSAIGDR